MQFQYGTAVRRNAMGPYECVYSERVGGICLWGWRWYYPSRALPWACKNGKAFHNWILLLKQGDPRIIEIFAAYLSKLCIDSLGNPDALVVVPPSKSYDTTPVYPLHRVGERAEFYGRVTYYPHVVKRVQTIARAVDDPRVRNVRVQRESLMVDGVFDEQVQSVVVVDDITTSGATIRAVVSLLAEAFPRVSISAFAFGKTQPTGSTPFPKEPAFAEGQE